MKILLKQVFIVDRQSPHHGGPCDILIENGRILSIANQLDDKADRVIRGKGWHVSPGWVDVFSHFCDPGYEYRETLETGAAAAAAGGFTDVFVIPNTRPVIDSKSQVEYIRKKSTALPVNVWPIGAMTRSLEGKDLAEMYDMRSSGAIAFSDGTSPVQSAGLLLKGLQYIKTFHGVIIQVPDDRTVGANGLINEGVISTRLGLPGKPIMAEELIISRDIELARYTDSRIHFTGVTSPRSLDAIRRAREDGLEVSCSVTPYHLFFNDADLTQYDTNLKVYPPLRDQAVVDSLRKGVLDGTVDCIATHHLPQVHDNKIIEFEYAQPGMTGLETAYAVLRTVLPQLTAERTVELLGGKARAIFGLEPATIKTGGVCSLSFFDPEGTTRIGGATTRSKSRNSPFLDRELKGRVVGVLNGEKEFWNEQS